MPDDHRPVPDPTELTVKALASEVAHLKELVLTMLAERDMRYQQRFEAQEHAVTVALERVDKEFHEHLLAAREESKAALAATEKAVQKAEDATSRAIDKAEVATDKRLDALGERIRRNEERISEISAVVTGGG